MGQLNDNEDLEARLWPWRLDLGPWGGGELLLLQLGGLHTPEQRRRRRTWSPALLWIR